MKRDWYNMELKNEAQDWKNYNYRIVNNRLPDVVIRKLDEIAREVGCSRNFVIQCILEKAVTDPDALVTELRKMP